MKNYRYEKGGVSTSRNPHNIYQNNRFTQQLLMS